LIHWPGTSNVKIDSPKNSLKRKETWKELETLQKLGKIKSIGVSNYTIEHLEELLSYCEIKPVVNQVEFHPWCFQSELLDFCQKNGILLQAYSPLTCGKQLEDEKLKEISTKYSKSTSQILLRWCLQKGAG
jgi:methylglyoxal/glyoxal reductase